MGTAQPSLLGSIDAEADGIVFVYGNSAIGRDPETRQEGIVRPGHHTVLEVVDRLKRHTAIELLDEETIALAVLLLTPSD